MSCLGRLILCACVLAGPRNSAWSRNAICGNWGPGDCWPPEGLQGYNTAFSPYTHRSCTPKPLVHNN
jgi:hypothetical protein